MDRRGLSAPVALQEHSPPTAQSQFLLLAELARMFLLVELVGLLRPGQRVDAKFIDVYDILLGAKPARQLLPIFLVPRAQGFRSLEHLFQVYLLLWAAGRGCVGGRGRCNRLQELGTLVESRILEFEIRVIPAGPVSRQRIVLPFRLLFLLAPAILLPRTVDLVQFFQRRQLRGDSGRWRIVLGGLLAGFLGGRRRFLGQSCFFVGLELLGRCLRVLFCRSEGKQSLCNLVKLFRCERTVRERNRERERGEAWKKRQARVDSRRSKDQRNARKHFPAHDDPLE